MYLVFHADWQQKSVELPELTLKFKKISGILHFLKNNIYNYHIHIFLFIFLGDKIMVSVNFKNSANKSAAEIAATTKPSMTIDIMCSPYNVIEASPEPIVDVYR